MRLVKWNPRFESPAFDTFDHFFNRDLSHVLGNDSMDTVPSINVLEGNDGFSLEVAAPGFPKDAFTVDVENDLLNISAELKTGNNTEDDRYTRREYSYGSFKRSFTLPDFVDGNKIDASYSEGILKIFIPKKDEAKVKAARMIKIS